MTSAKFITTIIASIVPTIAMAQVVSVPPSLLPIAGGAATGPMNPVGVACEIVLSGVLGCQAGYFVGETCLAPISDAVVTWCLGENGSSLFSEDDDWFGADDGLTWDTGLGTSPVQEPVDVPVYKQNPKNVEECESNSLLCRKANILALIDCITKAKDPSSKKECTDQAEDNQNICDAQLKKCKENLPKG